MDITPSMTSLALPDSAANRVCTKCLRALLLSAFEVDSRGYGDGYRTRCRKCRYAGNRKYISRTFKSGGEAARKWRSKEENRIRDKQYAKNYRTNKVHIERARYIAWSKKNRAALNAKSREYVARKLKATPKWANAEAIIRIYELAKRLSTPKLKYHVDHIVPLKSPLVCGLHWEGNLRVLPAAENAAKSNRTWPDSPQ